MGAESTGSNRLIAALPLDEYSALSRHFKPEQIAAGQILCDAGLRIRYSYFLTSGLACTFNFTKEGAVMATFLKGREGFVDLPLLLDSDAWPSARTKMIIAGAGLRIDSTILKERLNGGGSFGTLLKRYCMKQIEEVMQNAVCGRMHAIAERFACMLLMISDRVGSRFPLTHETLADLLGSRRATVSLQAEKMQQLRIIQYAHGRMQILSRNRLEQLSCECYEVQRRLSSVLAEYNSFEFKRRAM